MQHFAVFLVLLCTLCGCASSLKGDHYSRNDAQRSIAIRWATITDIQPVVIEGQRTVAGQAAGAAVGGAAGHSSTDSSSRTVATAIGVVAGAIAGQAIEEKVTRAQGLEIHLELDNGESIAIIQESDDINEFQVGQRVKILVGGGKMRVRPANGDD
jgi:outer membrane lipoprotein SlyB